MPAAVNGLKECSKCRETQPVSEYSKSKSYSDGLQYACKSCARNHYQNNKERMSKHMKEYYEANKEHILKHTKRYRDANKEKILKRNRQYYRDNREYLNKKSKEWVQKLPAAVYKIENIVTGKIYIGQSTQYPFRWYGHRCRMRKGKHHCLQHDYDEYGADSFEFSIIQEYPCDTDSDILLEHEQQLIDEYISEGKELYNVNS
jgi:hypothetical protein